MENDNRVFEKRYINNLWQVADNSVQINRNLSDHTLIDIICISSTFSAKNIVKCTYKVFALNIDFVIWSKIRALKN